MKAEKSLLLSIVIFLNHLMNEVMKHGHQHIVGNPVLPKDPNALVLRRLACLFGSLWSSAHVQKVFYRSHSICRWTSDVFVGRDVFFLSYSSVILEVLLDLFFLK